MDIVYKLRREAFHRRFSTWTIKSYEHYIKDFLKFCGKEPKEITKKDVREYLDYLAESKSSSTVNIAYSAIKFLIKEGIGKDWKWGIRYSRKPKRIPSFLTKQEVSRLLGCIKKEQHYLLVALMYSAGLRLSEVINLKAEDIDLENNIGYVRQGKGSKDRIFIIADKIKDSLRAQPEGYIFKGRSGKLHRRTAYKIVKHYAKKARIKKNVHPHTLRHSFATHLIENNCPVEIVQRLLGHNSPEATDVYIHAVMPNYARITSPLDIL